MKEFKDFLLRGNLVTLAVAFVMGVVFAKVVDVFVQGLVMPIVAAILGKYDFSGLTFTIHHSVFLYGSFLTVLITFVATAAAVFYFVVKPYNMLEAKMAKDAPATDKECPHCLSTIPVAASVCFQCTRDVGAAGA